MQWLSSMLLLVLGCAHVCVANAQSTSIAAASVVRVSALLEQDGAAFGSGVVVGPEVVATNCHVLRGAQRIEVEYHGRKWPAQLHAGDPDLDVCLLAVARLPLAPVRIRSSATLNVGDSVSASGYPAGGILDTRRGRVEALHRLSEGRVIQTSARFERGASGGALFTDSGELVGLLTFKVPTGGAFHFAVPVDWIEIVARSGRSDALAVDGCAFWEHDPSRRTPFLSAVWHEANRDWSSLYRHCLEWLSAEPENDEARRAMLRAIDAWLVR